MAKTHSLGNTELVSAYRTMVLMRRFDEVALQLRLDGKIDGVVHPYFGQEAIAVGIMSALRPTDRIVSNHRGHGHLIAKGAELRRMFAELFGRQDGYCRGKGGSMHIAAFDRGILGANGIVAAGLPIGAGSALACRLRGDDSVVVAFFGDGATGQGVFHEALNYSALASLPIVWVCENNGYAVGNPLVRSIPVDSVAMLVGGYGMTVRSVDGTDIETVFDAASVSIAEARAGNGPVFLECSAFRLGIHSQRGVRMPETRSPDIMAEGRRRDPVAILEARLLAAGALDTKRVAAIHAEVESELDAAIAFAMASPLTEPEEALMGVYA